MTSALDDLAALVLRESGIRLAGHQHDALRAALARAAPGVGAAEFLRLAADPARGGAAIDRLLDEVSVQESSFFRDPAPFERLHWAELVAAARAAGHGVVRVWVAGCATGEEAYTLAILALEAFAPERPPVAIVATDVSRRALAHARAARYGERTLRGLGHARRERWLREVDGHATVREEVRGLVQFRHHNLVAEPAPPPGEARFHVIVCRNVLIYFDRATAARTIDRLESALVPGGALVLGAVDTLAGGAGRRAPPAAQRRPRRAAPGPEREERLARARRAADAGRVGDARAELDALLRRDPLDADAHALRGLVELAAGDADRAVESLRRALYVEPRSGLAAFMLGRAHDAAGHSGAARAAYARALPLLGRPEEPRAAAVLGEIDVDEIEAACRARLGEGGPP